MFIFYKEQIKTIEANAENSGFSSSRMMENAGSAAAKIIEEKLDISSKKIVIVAGKGNNGGDGFVVARKFFEAGRDVTIVLADGVSATASAQEMLSKLTHYPIRIYEPSDLEVSSLLKSADIIIDAIFGIGFSGEIAPSIAGLIYEMNHSSAFRIALDLPSGAECDTGRVSSVCFNADITISFIAIKPCHLLYPSADYCGKLIKAGIGLPAQIVNSVSSNNIIIEETFVKSKLPKRAKNSHKGSYGTALFLCGSYGMSGAAYFSAKAALRSGLGLSKIMLPESIYPIVASYLPESVYLPYGEEAKSAIVALENNSQKVDCIVAGCGLGRSQLSQKLVNNLLESNKIPLVLDADGINIASQNIELLLNSKAQMVLTPHPAEMARLMNTTTDYIQNNRFKAARVFARESGKIVILKGSNSVIGLPDGRLYVCTKGNPGMATGGSGDVLAGIVGSLIAQGFSPEDAAICGTWFHAAAGDIAAMENSMIAMLPSDIIDSIPLLFKELEK